MDWKIKDEDIQVAKGKYKLPDNWKEFNEYTSTENTNSLFNNYYSNYINDVFNKKARIYKFTAYLPSHIVNRYELNDTFIIAGREYIINSIKINLLNNKAELELLNKL